IDDAASRVETRRRQVAADDGARGAAADGGAEDEQLVEAPRSGVADRDHVDARLVEHAGRALVPRDDADDLPPLALHRLERGDGQSAQARSAVSTAATSSSSWLIIRFRAHGRSAATAAPTSRCSPRIRPASMIPCSAPARASASAASPLAAEVPTTMTT